VVYWWYTGGILVIYWWYTGGILVVLYCFVEKKVTKFDKVVKREVCQVTTPGTRTSNFLEGETIDAVSQYLLAVCDKVPSPYTLSSPPSPCWPSAIRYHALIHPSSPLIRTCWLHVIGYYPSIWVPSVIEYHVRSSQRGARALCGSLVVKLCCCFVISWHCLHPQL